MSRVVDLLPECVVEADDGTLAAFAGGAEAGLARAADVLARLDPDTSVSGTCELADPAACPGPWLPWLGALLGIDTGMLPAAEVRAALAAAAATQRRGTVAAIATAVARTLTGGRSVRVRVNESGAEPYLLTVITVTSQTPSPASTLLAALSEKPAGMDLILQSVTGSTWAELAEAFSTWNDVAAELPAWDDVAAWIPED